ncbi:unnamed protein product [Malus baccata var. baccata]
MEGNHNSQKLHTLLIKTCEAKPIYWCQQELHQWKATIILKSFTNSWSRQCEAKPIYGVNKSFIKGVQPQFSKASHTLDQDSVKQNQFICEAKPIYSANKGFINGGQPQFSKASHTLDQDSMNQNQFMVPARASSKEFNHNSQKLHTILIKTV